MGVSVLGGQLVSLGLDWHLMPYVNLLSLLPLVRSLFPYSFLYPALRLSLSWSSVALVSRELPIFLGGITGSSNGRVGMSMGGRPGRRRARGGERQAVTRGGGLWSSPSFPHSCVRASLPPSLFIPRMLPPRRWYSYQCYVD